MLIGITCAILLFLYLMGVIEVLECAAMVSNEQARHALASLKWYSWYTIYRIRKV